MSSCEKAKKDHVQVPFKTKSGKSVEVDQGMLEILTLLRECGVETQFSCQGRKPFGGYILGHGPGMTKLLAKMYYLHKRGRYSNDVSWLVHRLLNSNREFEYGRFRSFTRKGDGVKATVTDKVHKLTLGGKYRNAYEIEQTYSAHYGWRTIIRWRKSSDRHHIETLLRETKELLGK